MRIIYIADDGTQFDNEQECEDYEWKLNHKRLNDVELYDAQNNRLTNYISQDTYENTEVVIVHNNEEIAELHDLAKYTGFYCYCNINSPGKWEFKNWGFEKAD